MQVFTQRVRRLSPILMNNPASMKASSGGKLKQRTIPSPEDEAREKVYRLESGELYIPSSWATGALMVAAKGRKIGKFTARAIVAGSVFAPVEYYVLIHPETGVPLREYTIDSRRAVVQKSGVRRSRPKVEWWAVIVVLEFDPEGIAPAALQELLRIAGRVAGFGDYAPHDNGPFGRFELDGDYTVTENGGGA